MTRAVVLPNVEDMSRSEDLVQRRHIDLCILAGALCR